MKGKILKISIVVALIMTLTMANFVLLGTNLISFALDSLATNHANVEFNAYFKDSSGKQTTSLNKVLNDEEAILYLSVNVKQEGYFNGKISLENSNFSLKGSESEYVNKIEKNTITLNQINANKNIEIPVVVEIAKKEVFDLSLLNMESKVIISGTYKDSTEKDISINSTRTVVLSFVSDKDKEKDNILNEAEIITDKIVKVNGEEKIVYQVALNLGLKNNDYPISQIESIINVPTINGIKPEAVKLIETNNMLSWDYHYDGQTVVIDMHNHSSDDSKLVYWKTNGNEKVILTFMYDYDESQKSSITESFVSTEKVVLYDESEITSTVSAKQGWRNLDNIIKTEIENQAEEIYKGNLYAGLNKEFTTTTKTIVTAPKIVKEIKVDVDNNHLENADGTIGENSIYYKNTVINKEELVKMLGENGTLTIKNQNGELVSILSNLVEADKDGNIVVTYNENAVTAITMETTAPVEAGILKANHTKYITPMDSQKDRNVVSINSSIATEYNKFKTTVEYSEGSRVLTESKIPLKETKTDATIEANSSSISTLTENKELLVTATLKSDSEKYDLYKNPTIQITLPEGINDVKVNSINKLYDDELTIGQYKQGVLADGRQAIRIPLTGTQTKFANNVSGGIQIVINLSLGFDKTTASKTGEITMDFTNENGTEKQYQTKTKISLVSKYGVLIQNKISGYNKNETIESIDNEVKAIKLETASTEKTISISRTIVNNYDQAITGISLIGKVPENEKEEINGTSVKSTFVASLADAIKTSSANATIYYSTQSEGNEWTQSVSDYSKIRAFKIELGESGLEAGQTLNIQYSLKVPEALKYNQSSYEKLDITYKYQTQTVKDTLATTFATDTQTVGDVEIDKPIDYDTIEQIGKVGIVAVSGNKQLEEGQEIYAGQSVKYIVTITNTTGKDINGLKMTAKTNNANMFDYTTHKGLDSLTGKVFEYTNYEEKEGTTQITRDIGDIANGQTKTIEYQVAAKETTGTLTGSVTIYSDTIKEKEKSTISNKITNGELKLNMSNSLPEEVNNTNNSLYEVHLDIKNVTNKEQKDLIAKLTLPKEVKLEKIDNASKVKAEITSEDTIKIASIPASTTSTVVIWLRVGDNKQVTKDTLTTMYYTIEKDGKQYISNQISKQIEVAKSGVAIEQKGSINADTVLQTGDKLVYTAYITNLESNTVKTSITDYVPRVAKITRAYYTVDNGQLVELTDIKNNKILVSSIEFSKQINLTIETTIDESLATTSTLTNSIEVTSNGKALKSNEVTYKLKNILEQEQEKEESDKDYDDTKNNEENNNNTVTDPEKVNSISGQIWLDINSDGIKDSTEQRMSGITVKLVDSLTGKIATSEGKEYTTKTDENGNYTFEKLPDGEYMVIFEYDSTKYSPTTYKKSDVKETVNSDIVNKTLDGKNVGITDVIKVSSNTITNIDAGLIENKIFDLNLNKYITKVTTQNSGTTQVTQYDNAQLAKLELDAKKIANTTVLVEYTIKITNEGEIPGYANEVVDYIPSDFKFSSEINKDWYSSTNGNLHNITLANEIINPGETKTLTLTLTKTMTENNVGMTANTAEIAKAGNNLSVADIDSTPANKAKGEDDMSTAELIISVRTGLEVTVGIATVIIILATIGGTIYIIKRKEV